MNTWFSVLLNRPPRDFPFVNKENEIIVCMSAEVYRDAQADSNYIHESTDVRCGSVPGTPA